MTRRKNNADLQRTAVLNPSGKRSLWHLDSKPCEPLENMGQEIKNEKTKPKKLGSENECYHFCKSAKILNTTAKVLMFRKTQRNC